MKHHDWFVRWVCIHGGHIQMMLKRRSATRGRVLSRGRIARFNTIMLRFSPTLNRFVQDQQYFKAYQCNVDMEKMVENARALERAGITEVFKR